MPSVRNPRSASAAQAAAHLCLSPKRFMELVARGTLTKANGGGYDLEVARREYLTFLRNLASGRSEGLSPDQNPDYQRARKDKQYADRLELQNALARGEQAPVNLFAQAHADIVEHIRLRLAPLPDRLAPRLVGRGRVEIREVLRDYVHSELATLATFEET